MKSRILAAGVLLAALGGMSACGSGASSATRVENGDRLLAKGQLPEALIEYRAAVQADERNGLARQKLGQAFAQIGDLENATAQLVRAADLLPDDVTVQMEAARILLATGRFEDARTTADRVIKLNPGNVVAHIVRATASAGLREPQDALTSIEKAVQLDPSRSASFLDLGTIQVNSGRSAEAEAGFKRAVALAPKSMEAHLALAGYYWHVNRPKDAEAALLQAIAIQPTHVQANIGLFNLYRSTGRPKDAEVALRRGSEGDADNVGLRLNLADFYAQQRNYQQARTLLTELAKKPESAAAAGARLAGVDYELGNPTEAYRRLEALIKEQPQNTQLVTVKGNWLLRERKYGDALKAAQAAAKLDEKSAEAQFLLGSAYTALGDLDEAEKALTEAIRLRPGAVDAQALLANINATRGKGNRAVELAREAVKTAPKDHAARFALAQSLLAAGDSTGARFELQSVLAAAPNSPEVLTLLGRIQWRGGDNAGARASFTKALEMSPGAVEALAPLLSIELAAKQPDAALARLEAQLKQAPNNARLLVVAGRTYAATGDLAKAETALQKAITADATALEAYHVLGQIFVRQKRLDDAVKAYSERLAEHPNDVPTHTMVGMLRIVQGKYPEARASFEKVLSLDPRAAVASNNLAYMDAEAGTNLDVALNRAQAAKAALPDEADVNDTLGWVYVKRGLPALAVAPIEDAIRKNPANPVYHYHLGMAHLKANDRDRARTSLQRALELSKSFEGASAAQQALAGLGQ